MASQGGGRRDGFVVDNSSAGRRADLRLDCAGPPTLGIAARNPAPCRSHARAPAAALRRPAPLEASSGRCGLSRARPPERHRICYPARAES